METFDRLRSMLMKKVVWWDIQNKEGPWKDQDDVDEIAPVKMTTLGWIVRKESDFIVTASTLTEDGSFGDLNAIPRGVIFSVTELQESSG